MESLENRIDQAFEFAIKMHLQILEIHEHKYYLSQKAGVDIGIEIATQDYIKNHASRFQQDFEKNKKEIVMYFKDQYIKRFSDYNKLHQLLKD